jgi:hypothetical protein
MRETLPGGETVPFAYTSETFTFNTTNGTDGVTRSSKAIATYPTHLLSNGDKRPVILIGPGWGGTGDSIPSAPDGLESPSIKCAQLKDRGV